MYYAAAPKRAFTTWVTQVMPSIFSESLSYYEALSKLNFVVEEHEHDILKLQEDVQNILNSDTGLIQKVDALQVNSELHSKQIQTLQNQSEVYKTTLAELQQEMQTFQDEFEKVKNGDYVSLYLDSIINYLDDHIDDLIGNAVTHIFFGLTPNGHFCALIPNNWNFIRFDTIIDAGSDLYGHLCLRW